MDHRAALSAFPFDHPQPPVSLSVYASVLRVRDRRGDWVLKRTGLTGSAGAAIGEWLKALRRLGVEVVAPADHLRPNPRRLGDGSEWVVHPFIEGAAYRATETRIAGAGRLLGKMHAADPPQARRLVTHDRPLVRSAEWVGRHLAAAGGSMRRHGLDPTGLEAVTADRLARTAPLPELPLRGCSADFTAANLVFSPKPMLVDPDHAAHMPRLYDLAVALLLFHCELRSAPGRVWTPAEWRVFLSGYLEEVTLVPVEAASWQSVLALAWLDQAVWLLGNWPEGWAGPKDRAYLADLAALDLRSFPLAGAG